jgi:hypothetical protein
MPTAWETRSYRQRQQGSGLTLGGRGALARFLRKLLLGQYTRLLHLLLGSRLIPHEGHCLLTVLALPQGMVQGRCVLLVGLLVVVNAIVYVWSSCQL